MKLIIRNSLLLFYFLFNTVSYAQKPPVEWGKISKEDLSMSSYPADTNAAAVILCDFGETAFDDKADLEYSRHLRVKILTPAGYDWATHSIVIYTKKGIEWISDIEGMTYSLGKKNEIVENELKEEDIFEQEIDEERTEYKFTLPALKPGCIIEIRYKIHSSSIWFVRNWKFQHDEPVAWSEYRIRYPRSIAYAFVTRGYEVWAIKEMEEVTQAFNGEAAAYFGQGVVRCMQNRWAVKNAPALRDEPFITTIDDYINQVEIQLAGYSFPGTGKQEVLSTWKKLLEELIDNENFCGKIDDGSEIEKLAEKIIRKSDSPEEKLKAIYDWVSKSIVWNKEEWIYAEQDVEEVLEYKKGNSAEITFLLVSLLRIAGITADPVILSTRDHGKIQNLYPIVSQFNYVVAQAKIGSRIYYLDATNPMRPYDLVPFKILNVQGLIIKKGEPEWVTISSVKESLRKTGLNVCINNKGAVKAELEEEYSGYKALNIRDDFSDNQELDIFKKLYDSEASGFRIDSTFVEGKDTIEIPLTLRCVISTESYAIKSGDIIYFNPFMIHRLKENPFKSAVRNFPVDYGYPSSYTITENINIPDDYEIKESLPDKNFHLSPNIGSYTRRVKIEGNLIRIEYKFEIKQSLINFKFYERLKAFYARIVASQEEQFVFVRKLNTGMPEQNNVQKGTTN